MSSSKIETTFIIDCPHCFQKCEILEINCAIFRCGIFKNSLQQIPPHLPKNECEYLFDNNLIYGCGKPFQIVLDENKKLYTAVICDYK